jgi:hypothetical protein
VDSVSLPQETKKKNYYVWGYLLADLLDSFVLSLSSLQYHRSRVIQPAVYEFASLSFWSLRNVASGAVPSVADTAWPKLSMRAFRICDFLNPLLSAAAPNLITIFPFFTELYIATQESVVFIGFGSVGIETGYGWLGGTTNIFGHHAASSRSR